MSLPSLDAQKPELYNSNVELEKSLEQLQAQNSLLDVLPLEHEDSLWKRIITGLPNGHATVLCFTLMQ